MFNPLIQAAALVLATYYVAFTIARLAGPFDLAGRLRHAVEARFGQYDHWLTEGVNCPVCVSFWVAPVLLALAATRPGWWLVVWLAVAGGATAVHITLERRDG